MIKYLLILFLFVLSGFCSKPFTVNDLHQLGRLNGGAVSPSGEYVAYSVQTWNPVSGKTSTNIRCTRISDRVSFDVTPSHEGISDSSPSFSPSFPDFIFFLSNRAGKTQLYYTSFPPTSSPSTPHQLSDVPLDLDNLKISNETVVFSLMVYPQCSDLECTVAKNAEIAARGSNTYQAYDQMFVRHWDEWDTGKVSHLFFSFLGREFKRGKITPILRTNPVDILTGLNTQSPVPPDGGAEMYDISADGLEVALTIQERTRDEAWRTDWKVYHATIGEKWVQLKKITEDFPGRTQNPRFSPDGKLIGFLAMDRKGLESDSLRLIVHNKLEGSYKRINNEFDRSIDEFQWLNNEQIVLLSTDNGTAKIFTTNLLHSPTITLLYDDQISTSSILKLPNSETSFISQRNSFQLPSDLWLFELPQTFSQITFVNSESLSQFSISTPELFTFTGGFGDTVQGWVFKPRNFQEDKTYPIAFLIHGGPESPWFQSWSYRWNPQLWASHGYGVVMINPHGSPGQGQNFTDAVINNWGGVPYEDLMNGLDAAVNKFPWLNNDRACAVGASYGGYMVNWIQGQTDRFKCLITHDGVFSTVSMFYATEEIWFPMAEYCPKGEVGCTPWMEDYRKGFEKYSPEMYVKNWKTPHLIFHGSHDYRIPISEGLSVFTALQVKGVPSRFVHFYEENHWVLRRENSIKWYEEVLGWLDKWTGNNKLEKE